MSFSFHFMSSSYLTSWATREGGDDGSAADLLSDSVSQAETIAASFITQLS